MLTARSRSLLNGLLVILTSLAVGGLTGAEASSGQSGTRPVYKDLAEGPPKLKPLSNSPISIKMSNDARIVLFMKPLASSLG